jgi:streptomycin 6-kinase
VRHEEIAAVLSDEWGLQPGEVLQKGFNFVVGARTDDGVDVVLKVLGPDPDATREPMVLRAYDGNGACRVLRDDPARRAFLLERIRPGDQLAELASTDDDAATRIGARLMQQLWRQGEFPTNDTVVDGSALTAGDTVVAGSAVTAGDTVVARSALTAGATVVAGSALTAGDTVGAGRALTAGEPFDPRHAFRPLAEWFRAFERLRARSGGGSGPLPGPLLDRAEHLAPELLASAPRTVPLHGDFHHFNVLRSDRHGWVAIDPKGMLGDPGYEVGPFVCNPNVVTGSVLARRLDILAEELDYERQRLHAWALAHAVLSACWTIEDRGTPSGRGLATAQVLMELAA